MAVLLRFSKLEVLGAWVPGDGSHAFSALTRDCQGFLSCRNPRTKCGGTRRKQGMISNNELENSKEILEREPLMKNACVKHQVTDFWSLPMLERVEIGLQMVSREMKDPEKQKLAARTQW